MKKLTLLFSLFVVASMILTACGGTAATQAPATQAPATQAPATQAPATQAPATQAPAGYHEAPSLDADVTSGKLPPVEKRLPSRIVAMSFCEPRSWTRVLSS